MIKTKDGNVTIEGNVADVLADVSCIIHNVSKAFVEAEIKGSKELITEAVEVGMMTEEELDARIEKEKERKTELLDAKKTLESIKGLLEKMMKGE